MAVYTLLPEATKFFTYMTFLMLVFNAFHFHKFVCLAVKRTYQTNSVHRSAKLLVLVLWINLLVLIPAFISETKFSTVVLGVLWIPQILKNFAIQGPRTHFYSFKFLFSQTLMWTLLIYETRSGYPEFT